MRNEVKQINYRVCPFEDLEAEEKNLIIAAKEVAKKAYAPYSKFNVGCAVQLADGKYFCGNNQENASYPCGLCAERTALFYANANYPNIPVIGVAIAAQENGIFSENPPTPCGSCRQALLETETRFGKKIKVILYGTSQVLTIFCIADLLPFQFDSKML